MAGCGPGPISKVRYGNPAKPSGKRLVQSRFCGEPSDDGKLGNPDRRRVADADL